MSVKRSLLVLKFMILTAKCTSLPFFSWTYFSSFLLPTPFKLLHSSENNYYQVSILKKRSNCWIELSSVEHPCQFLVCDHDKLSCWSLWAFSWSLKRTLGCLSWLPHNFIVRINWNRIWSGLKMGTNYWHVREQSYYKANINPTPLWHLTIDLFWTPSKY